MRYFEPERLCGREINDKLELGRLLDRVLRAESTPDTYIRRRSPSMSYPEQAFGKRKASRR